MHEDFLKNDFYLMGSTYFFGNLEGFHSKDKDFGKFQDQVPFFKETCHTRINEDDYFIWKKKSPQELINEILIRVEGKPRDAVVAGKYLIPEICNQVGITLDHIKQLKPVFDNIGYRHNYEKIIYNYYIENNGFFLTEAQRMEAFEDYKKDRMNTVQEEAYKQEDQHWVLYYVRPKKLPYTHNIYGRDSGLISLLSIAPSEQQVAIDLFNFFKKEYPEICAYESVNTTSRKKTFIMDNFLIGVSGFRKSIDLDSVSNKWDFKLEEIIKENFLLRNIHCDLQRSPHGAHFIVDGDVEKCKILLESIIDEYYKDKEKDIYTDIISNVKILDGITLGDFKVETIKNWT